MGAGNHADVWVAFGDPAVVHGMREDYRTGLRIDRAHEQADRAAGRKIGCPMLLLVSTSDDLDIHGDPETIWRPWVADELAAAPFIPDITRPNRHRTNSPWHLSSSSGEESGRSGPCLTTPASRQAGGLASDAHGASALLRAAPDTAQTPRTVRRQTRSVTATGPPTVREEPICAASGTRLATGHPYRKADLSGFVVAG